MKRVRKRYLYTGEPLPRTTAYRRRKAGASYRLGQSTNVVLDSVISDGRQVAAISGQPSPINGIQSVDHEQNSADKIQEVSVDVSMDLDASDVTAVYCNDEQAVMPVEKSYENGSTIESSGRESIEESHLDVTLVNGLAAGESSSPLPQTNDTNVLECTSLQLDGISSTEQQTPYDERLCECLTTTSGDVMVMCLALGLRHNLPWVAQVDILKMINCIFGKIVVPATKYLYLKHVEKGKDITTFHIFCPLCEVYLGNKYDLSESVNCICGEVIEVSKAQSFFLSSGLEEQLKDVLKDPVIAEQALTYRFNRNKANDDSLEDIYDGAEYKRLSTAGEILSYAHNLSYSFNTDGIPMGKSSNKTIWPIYITLNELAPRERSKHVLLAGLYVGPKDPNMKVFLQPFVKEANKLSNEGFTWIYKDQAVNSKVVPLCSVVDSVARWQLLNMSSFGAYYGCTFCYQKAEHTEKGCRYTIPKKKYDDRTHESTIKDMQEAHTRRNEAKQKDRIVKGVKGPSPLMTLAFFNLITGMVPDYMHALLLGVVRLHTELLLESVRKKFWIGMDDSIGIDHLKSAIDERLNCIKPPRSITRMPRGLNEMRLWKASEWRSWLLFYIVPCLCGLLKRKHLAHISLLSNASNILLQKSIAPEEVNQAHNFLLKYTFLFQKYFGKTHMVYNVHLLSHLTKGVLNWGPLWTHNAFLYEGQNRHLLQLHKSPAHVALQLSRKFLTYNSLPNTCDQLASSEQSLEFCEDIMGRKLKHFVRCDGTVLIGRGLPIHVSAAEKTVLLMLCIQPSDCRAFEKMLHNGVRYGTNSYSVGKKNDDSVVCTSDNKIVVIQRIMQVMSMRLILLVQEVTLDRKPIVDHENVTLSYIRKVVGTGQLLSIEPKEIKAQCILMRIGEEGYICKMPFGCYGD